MKRLYYLITTLISMFIANNCMAQVFSLTNINYSNLPYISSQFIALDELNNPYKDLSPNDFRIVENNTLIPTSDVTVNCIETTIVPPVDVVLAIDQSSSMLETAPDSKQRWDWVVEGATKFVNTLDFVNAPSSRIAVVSFGTYSYLRCGFSSNRQEINDSILRTSVGGGTSFRMVLLDRNIGAISLLASRTSGNRRIIVFLTDGQPQDQTPTQEIINLMLDNSIQFYAITLGTEMNADLQLIASQTGGKSFSASTLADVRGIYNYIALDIQKKQTCTLTWKSAFPCSTPELSRSVDVHFARTDKTFNLSYTLPASALFNMKKSTNTAYFGNPAPGNFSDVEVAFTPETDDYFVPTGGVRIEPNSFFEITDYDVGGTNKTPPLSMPKGVERRMNIRFTQSGSMTYRQAVLTLDGSPCPARVDLKGGLSRVVLIAPDTAKLYSSCSPIDIEWIGTETTSVINLYYSIDGKQTWIPIATNISGTNKYSWANPPLNREIYIMITRNGEYGCFWVRQIGGPNADVVKQIAFDRDTATITATGYFTDSIRVGDTVINSNGLKDIFIARYNTDGDLQWFKTAGSRMEDSSAHLIIDTSDNIYITGSFCSGARMGAMTFTLPDQSGQYCFVAKMSPSGLIYSVYVVGSKYTTDQFEAHGQRLSFDPTTKIITLYGIYKGTYKDSKNSLPKATVFKPFTATFDTDLIPDVIQSYAGSFPASMLTLSDGNNNTYSTANFSGTTNQCSSKLVSAGSTDIYIKKTGLVPGSSDTLAYSVESRQPQVAFSMSEINFQIRITGALADSTVKAALCNTDSIPVTIVTAYVNSAAGVFSLGNNLAGTVINPGECIDISLSFNPTSVGNFNGTLVITVDCPQGKTYTLALRGAAVCNLYTLGRYDFPVSGIGEPQQSGRLALITNHNPDPIEVLVSITGDVADFTSILPSGSYMLAPDSSLYSEFEFTPQSVGKKSITIAYAFNAGCPASSTIVAGEGIQTDVSITNAAFRKHRILTTTKKKIYIENKTSIDRSVTNIDFEPSAKNAFSFQRPNLPWAIKANSMDSIEISFIPSEEIQYSNKLLFTVVGQSSPIASTLTGEGILPKISLRYECSEPIKRGTIAVSRVYISNPSASADLYVESISLRSTQHYHFPAPPPMPATIRSGEETFFDIIFAPQTSGMIGNAVLVNSDAAPGPEESPIVQTTLEYSCEATGEDIPEVFNFEGTMICTQSILTESIKNNSTTQSLTIDKATISGPDKDFFSLQNLLPIELPPNASLPLSISFSPDEEKAYSAVLTLKSGNTDLGNVRLEGNGVSLRLYFEQDTLYFTPGQTVSLNVFGSYGELRQPPVSISSSIEFNRNTLNLGQNPIRNGGVSGISWNQTNWRPATITGNGNFPNLFSGLLFSADFSSYLGDSISSFVGVRPVYVSCNGAITDSTFTKVTGVCFSEGRFVEVGVVGFGLESLPNPLRSNAKLTYKLPFDMNVDISVYNSIGTLVLQLVNSHSPKGVSSAVFPAEELSSGLYLVRMTGGGQASSLQVIIEK